MEEEVKEIIEVKNFNDYLAVNDDYWIYEKEYAQDKSLKPRFCVRINYDHDLKKKQEAANKRMLDLVYGDLTQYYHTKKFIEKLSNPFGFLESIVNE